MERKKNKLIFLPFPLSTVLFTLRDGLLTHEIYLSRVSLVILIIHCVLPPSTVRDDQNIVLTNFRRTRLQVWGMGPIWLMKELACKNFPKTRIQTILDKSRWDNTAIFIFFLSFLGSLLKRCILLKNLLQFSLSPPYTKLKLEKKSGYTCPTLLVG